MHFLHRVAALLCAAALGLLVLFSPMAASASETNDYTKMVANSLRSNPVYVDKSASPTITSEQAAQLATQIRQSGKPIYLILVDNNQTKKFSGPTEFLKQIHNDLGSSGSHVIGVSTSKSFSANGYNLPQVVANQAGPLTGPAMKNGGNNPYRVFSYWIDAVAKLRVPSGTTTKPATTPAQSSSGGGSGVVIFLIILGVAVLILLGFLALRAWFRSKDKKKNEETEANRLERRADSIGNSLMALEPELAMHPNAGTAQMNGLEAVQSARTALATGDTADAGAYLSTAKRHLDSATAIINGQPTRSVVQDRLPDDDTDDYQPSGAPSMASSTVRVQRPGGRAVTINQNSYSQHQAPGYGHYYGGGMYGGQYWAPGYYSDPFWNYLILSEVLDHNHHDHGDYDRGYEAGHRDNGGSYSSEGTAASSDWGTTTDWGSSDSDDSQAEVVDEGEASGTSWDSNDFGSQPEDTSSSWSSGSDSSDSSWGSSNDSSSNSWSSDSGSDSASSDWGSSDSGGSGDSSW